MYIPWGEGLYTWGLIFGRKNTSICNLLNLLLFFIFESVVHQLRTNYVNVYVSKIYPSGLTIGGGGGVAAYIRRSLFRYVNWASYLGAYIWGDGEY